MIVPALSVSALLLRLLVNRDCRRSNFDAIVASSLHAGGAWLLVIASGALAPWLAIPFAAGALFPIHRYFADRLPLWLMDTMLVAVVATLANANPLSPIFLLLGLAFVVSGYVARWIRFERRAPRLLLQGFRLAVVGIGVVALFHILLSYAPKVGYRSIPVLTMGVGTSTLGDRVALPTSAIGWQARPFRTRSDYQVLFLHGANRNGAAQPAGDAIRRAALRADMPVFSLDFPGFGGSPAPVSYDSVEAWDPTPHIDAAVKEIREAYSDKKIILIGHSMGTSRALYYVRNSPAIMGVVIFGAAPSFAAAGDEYWYDRFHSDRGMSSKRIPYATWREIEARYVGAQLTESLPRMHPPIVNVYFEFEHDDIIATRDLLSESIPGDLLNVTLEGSNHYFDAHAEFRLFFEPAPLVARLEKRLVEWTAWIESASIDSE